MMEYNYRQRAQTKEFDKGHERIYGKRCPKHPGERIDNQPCPRCAAIETTLRDKR